MTTGLPEYDESDCCGNGCANCVLDLKSLPSNKLKQEQDSAQEINILQNYRKFCLLSKQRHLSSDTKDEIYELHFKYKEGPEGNCRLAKEVCNGHTDQHNNKTVPESYKDKPINEKKCNISNDNQVDNQNSEAKYVLSIKPGHHLMLRVLWTQIPASKNRKPDIREEKARDYLLRPYSPFWWHKFNLEFKILVDFRLQGPMSSYLQQSVREDDLLEFRGPIGVYEHQPDPGGERILVILTQGVAIAAVIAIIEQILHNDDDLQRIVHFACFRHLNSVCFREKLYNFSHYWNYKVHIFLSRQLCNRPVCLQTRHCSENCPEFCNQLKYREQCYPCRMTEEYLYQLLSKTVDIKKNSNLSTVNYFQKSCSAIIGGSPDFQKHYQNILLSEKFQFNPKEVFLL